MPAIWEQQVDCDQAPIFPPGTQSFTVSCTSSQEIQTTEVSQRVDQYLTRLTAHLLGGPLVYDQTFNLPFSDPLVQSGILAAQLSLQALASPLAFIGPVLIDSSTTFQGSLAETVIDSQLETFFTGFENTIGPGTIFINNRGVCAGVNTTTSTPFGCAPGVGNSFFVDFGLTNLNINTHTLTQIFQTTTTTNTFLTSELYDLTGDPAVEPIPEPGTVLLTAAGLAALALLRRTGDHHRDIA